MPQPQQTPAERIVDLKLRRMECKVRWNDLDTAVGNLNETRDTIVEAMNTLMQEMRHLDAEIQALEEMLPQPGDQQ